MLDGMSDSIQGSRIENLHSREVDRQSPTGLIFVKLYFVLCSGVARHHALGHVPLSWRRSIVVRTLVSAGELFLSFARLLAGWVTTLWLSHPLLVNQHGQLSHPPLRGR